MHVLVNRPDPGPGPRRVALLGAAGSGKTRLAGELMAALDSHSVPHPAPASILIADNPPLAALRLARGGEMNTVDGSGFDQILLMGLDLPAPPSIAAAQEAADQQLRLTLANAHLPYTVVYGQGPQRLAHALDALLGLDTPPTAGVKRHRPWVWTCDTCSDPGCERRLLSDLLASRSP